MNTRNKFKAIRKQRKLALKTLGEVAGSATSISDFENGKTNLSNDVLFQLLAYMVVEINEFFEWEDFQDKDFVNASKDIEKALRLKDKKALSNIKADFTNLANQKRHYIYQVIALVLEVMICDIDNKEVHDEVISQLTDYFFSLDYWTNLDVGLLGNLVSYFTTDALLLFTNTILNNTPQTLKNNLDRIKIDTVLNCLSVFIDRKHKAASHQLIQKLFSKDYPSYFAFEKLYLHELQAMYDYLWENQEKALATHYTILNTVELLFSASEAKEWHDNFKKHIS